MQGPQIPTARQYRRQSAREFNVGSEGLGKEEPVHHSRVAALGNEFQHVLHFGHSHTGDLHLQVHGNRPGLHWDVPQGGDADAIQMQFQSLNTVHAG